MKLLSVLGILAFTAASIAMAYRLLRLGWRTWQAPELGMGASFLGAGAIGFPLVMAAGVVRTSGGDAETTHRLAVGGVWFLSAGYLSLAIANWRIYRPGSRSVPLLAAALGALLLAACLVCTFATDPSQAFTNEIALWTALVAGSFVFGWGGVESFVLYDALRKRARIGLASPEVANRVLLWGIGGFASCAMPLHGLAGRILIGPEVSDAYRGVTSLIGLVVAVAIWLAFFPPAAYRARFHPEATPLAAGRGA